MHFRKDRRDKGVFMTTSIRQKVLMGIIDRNIKGFSKKQMEATEKLSSGKHIKGNSVEGLILSQLGHRLSRIGAYKIGLNSAVSLLQITNSTLFELTNLIQRMAELHVNAASHTINNRERLLMLIEYQTLFNEVTRLSETTNFNEIYLLASEASEKPEELILQLGGDLKGARQGLNVIHLKDLEDVDTTAEGLGLITMHELIEDADLDNGLEPELLEESLNAKDEYFPNLYEEINFKLDTYRAVFNAIQSRLEKAQNFYNIFIEKFQCDVFKQTSSNFKASSSSLDDKK